MLHLNSEVLSETNYSIYLIDQSGPFLAPIFFRVLQIAAYEAEFWRPGVSVL